MQIKKELAEMTDASVQLISLVETGANAAPFKRLKSEEPEGGIDVFQAEKLSKNRGADGPQLIALAVSPKGDVKAAKAIAKAAGVEIQETREVEGDDGKTTLLLARKQDRVNTGDPNQIQIYLDEELTAVCRVEKTFMPFNGSTSFSEAIKAQGYFPQLRNALDVFGEVAFHILDSADSPNAAATKISKASEELGKLLTLMTKALPKETFKMAEVIKSLKAEGGEGNETLASKEEDEKAAKAKTDADAVEAKAKEEADAKAKAKADEDAEAAAALAAKAEHEDEEEEDGKKKGKKAKPFAKKDGETETDATLGKILDAIESLTTVAKQHGEAQAELKKELEAVAEKADAAKETATAAEKAANETDAAVTGRVSTDTAPDGKGREERVSKGAPPLMDTGMSRYRARGGVN
jgi:hypothetical protein